MAITKDQIFQAADQLTVAGESATMAAVRKLLGGGSYTTISPVLNEWKARQKEATAPLREPAPQAVGDRLAEVGADIWAMALGLANSRLAAEREALEKARADMEAAQAEAAEHTSPGWIEVIPGQLRVLVHTLPTREQIDTLVAEQLIVELYSK